MWAISERRETFIISSCVQGERAVFIQSLKYLSRVHLMAQKVKGLGIKPDDLISLLRTHNMGGEDQLCSLHREHMHPHK